MEMATLIPAILFGLAGLLVIIYLLSLILKNFLSLRFSAINLKRLKYRRKKNLLRRARESAKAGKLPEALSMLRSAFMLDHLRKDLQLIESVQELHLAILQELITLSKRHALKLSSLSAVEEQLAARTGLMKAYYETNIAAKALKKRSKERPPAWAVAEFERKRADLLKKIETNRAELDKQLETLFEDAGRSGPARSVIYH